MRVFHAPSTVHHGRDEPVGVGIQLPAVLSGEKQSEAG